MKAKYFKKLKSKSKYFYVSNSESLFGSFYGIGKSVLAFNHENAAYRFIKRTSRKESDIIETSQEWAKYKVVPSDNPFPRFTKYFRH